MCLSRKANLHEGPSHPRQENCVKGITYDVFIYIFLQPSWLMLYVYVFKYCTPFAFHFCLLQLIAELAPAISY